MDADSRPGWGRLLSFPGVLSGQSQVGLLQPAGADWDFSGWVSLNVIGCWNHIYSRVVGRTEVLSGGPRLRKWSETDLSLATVRRAATKREELLF